MRIIQVINDINFKNGGAQKIVYSISEMLNKRQIPNEIVTLSANKIIGLGNYSVFTFLLLSFRMMKLKLSKYDIIHVHLFPAVLYIRMLKVLWPKTTIIYTEHSTSNNRRNLKLFYRLDQWIYSGLDRIVVVSRGVGEELIRYLPQTADKIILIYNGIHLDSSSGIDFMNEITQNSNQKIIKMVSFGRLIKLKSFDRLIELVMDMNNNGFDFKVHLDIFGIGPEFKKLNELVDNLNGNNYISLKGYVEEIDLSDYSVFALLSKYEGFGLSILESMSQGLICVLSEVNGMKELSDEITCNNGIFFIDSRIQGDFNSKLVRIDMERNSWKQWGLNNKNRAQHFSLDQMFHNYCNLYQECLPKIPE
jgi:glycosyltransferase involved in cell wall biosynthesis